MSGYDHLFKITVSYSEVTTFMVPFFSLNVVLFYRKKITDLGKPPLESRRTKILAYCGSQYDFFIVGYIKE
jgi:hypothetical protein